MGDGEKKKQPSPWPEDDDKDYHPYGDGAYPENEEGGRLGGEGPNEEDWERRSDNG